MTRISRVLFLGSVVLIEHYPSAHHKEGYLGFSQSLGQLPFSAADHRKADLALYDDAHTTPMSLKDHQYLTASHSNKLPLLYFP